MLRTADRGVTTAVRLLRRIFAPLEVPLAFRLWDGTVANVGGRGECAFVVGFRSAPVFRRIVRRPTPLRFGEAYIAGEIDIDGDMFAAMNVAAEIDHLRVPFSTRLAVLAGLLRV
jgi:cyclopropane-fatty-acyl-phospholipid synthase